MASYILSDPNMSDGTHPEVSLGDTIATAHHNGLELRDVITQRSDFGEGTNQTVKRHTRHTLTQANGNLFQFLAGKSPSPTCSSSR